MPPRPSATGKPGQPGGPQPAPAGVSGGGADPDRESGPIPHKLVDKRLNISEFPCVLRVSRLAARKYCSLRGITQHSSNWPECGVDCLLAWESVTVHYLKTNKDLRIMSYRPRLLTRTRLGSCAFARAGAPEDDTQANARRSDVDGTETPICALFGGAIIAARRVRSPPSTPAPKCHAAKADAPDLCDEM